MQRQRDHRIRPNLSSLLTGIACLIAIIVFMPYLSARADRSSQAEGSNASDAIKRALAEEINAYRMANGFPPYAISPQLSVSAQAHADDMVAHGFFSHKGSDGSLVGTRIARTEYGAWSQGYRVGENYYAGTNPANAMRFWLGDGPHTNNLLHTVYREMGIGHGINRDGWHILVVDVGAQPNVLPVFINDDQESTSNPVVWLTLTNERAVLQGEGERIMGSASEIMVSNSPTFEGSAWQPYQERIEWRLESGSGRKTVWVRFRDAHGRTTTSSDEIWLDVEGVAMEPTATQTSAPTPTATPSLTLTPTRVATATQTFTLAPSATLAPTSTLAPSSTIRPTDTSAPRPPSPEPQGPLTQKAEDLGTPAAPEITSTATFPIERPSRTFGITLAAFLIVILLFLLVIQIVGGR